MMNIDLNYCQICNQPLEDPKELPCEHLFCEACLKELLNEDGTLTCPNCQVTHSFSDFDKQDSLPNLQNQPVKIPSAPENDLESQPPSYDATILYPELNSKMSEQISKENDLIEQTKNNVDLYKTTNFYPKKVMPLSEFPQESPAFRRNFFLANTKSMKIISSFAKLITFLAIILFFICISIKIIRSCSTSQYIVGLTCHEKKKFQDQCATSYECNDEASLYCINGTCICESISYFYDKSIGKCNELKSEGSICSTSSQCLSPMICSHSQCKCPLSNNFYNSFNKTCESKKSFNQHCSSNFECNQNLGLSCQYGNCLCDPYAHDGPFNAYSWYNQREKCMQSNLTCKTTFDCPESYICLEKLGKCASSHETYTFKTFYISNACKFNTKFSLFLIISLLIKY